MDNIELFKLAAQLGVGAFMGIVFGVILYLINRSQLKAFEDRHNVMISTFAGSLKDERDRNDRDLALFFGKMDKLSDAFELAKCRYPGFCSYNPPELPHFSPSLSGQSKDIS